MAKPLTNAIPAGFESDDEEFCYQIADLKIKRLKDITTGAGIHGDFDAKLDDELQIFFTEFRDKFNMNSSKTSPHMRQALIKTLLQQENPLLVGLKVFANCPDCNNLKSKSLAFFVLETVSNLPTEHPHLTELCDDNTSMIAFHFVRMTGMLTLNNAMMKAYRMEQIRELLVPKLREMLDEGLYKEVTQWSINLDLTHQFDMLDLAFPLIAQEKLSLAELYLERATHQRLPFVQFLDSLLHKDKSVIEMLDGKLSRYNNLKISHNVLSYRAISKIVARLAKKYNFDDTVTPNYKFTKTLGYLHYLCREYDKSGINLASFRELVRMHANSYDLQSCFVSYLACTTKSSLEPEAIYWYHEFKLLPEDCPPGIQSLISQHAEQVLLLKDNASTAAGAGDCDMYLSMDLPEQALIIVSTGQQFNKMLRHLQGKQIIYMDAEWVQQVCGPNKLCLMQIATTRHVYLIDCLADGQEITDVHWHNLGASVFNNTNILKVGFYMVNDLLVLQRSLPLQLRLQLPHHYLDLSSVWLELKKQRRGVELPFGNVNRAGDALSDLCQLCLGKKLSKVNQCSNWANRPLRHDQILYAAMDARCLMLIHHCLLSCVPNINSIIEKSIASNNFQRRGNNSVK